MARGARRGSYSRSITIDGSAPPRTAGTPRAARRTGRRSRSTKIVSPKPLNVAPDRTISTTELRRNAPERPAVSVRRVG